MNEPLKIERHDDNWTFILNRPEKRNALSVDLVESLIEGVENAHDQNIPLLAFRGAGKNLSAGFDFTGYEDQSEGDLVLRMVRIEHLLQLIAGSPALTIALAHGRNFGAGVDLFAACKQRHCTSDTSFRMPGLKFGLILGTRRFRSIVGTDHALSILGTARSFEADEAVRIGFVQQIAADTEWEGLLDQARQMALALEHSTRISLYQALDTSDADTDMAALVRSASRPQLKTRIKAYLGG